MSLNVDLIPPHLREWYGRLGGQVLIRYTPPEERRLPYLVSGKLVKIAATGAWVRISGVETDKGGKATLDFPLERCTLLDSRAEHT